MQAWQAVGRRGLGGLLALRMTAEGPAAQREAPPTDEVLISTASPAGVMIDRATSDMVIRYIFTHARAAGHVQRFCQETEQVVRAVSADQKVQRSIVEAWERERREEGLRSLVMGGQEQRQLEGESPACCSHSPAVATGKEPASSSCSPATTERAHTDPMREAVQAMRCAICLSPYQDATMLNCAGSHVFCRQCVARLPVISTASWLPTLSLNPLRLSWKETEARTCPLCRSCFTKGFPVRVVDNLISSLKPVLCQAFDDDDDADDDHDALPADPWASGGTGAAQHDSRFIFAVVTLVVVVAMVLSRRGGL